MRILSKLVLAGAILGAYTMVASTAASAAVAFTSPSPFDPGITAPEVMVWDFDTIANSNFSYTGPTFTSNVFNIAAEPAGLVSPNTYGAGEPGPQGGPATFSINSGLELTSLSFYLGSLDNFNTISFYDGGTLVQAYTGTNLTIPNPANGNQGSGLTNRRYFFTFGAADHVNTVVFSSTSPAFEFDNIAAAWTSAVPEPATWTMLILGFGFVGFMLRGNRRRESMIAA